MMSPHAMRTMFPATLSSLAKSRKFIRQALVSFNLDEYETDIQLAVGEVMQNIIRHGYGGGDTSGQITIKIYCNHSSRQMFCWIRDTAPPAMAGEWFSHELHRKPEDGGLGLGLIQTLTEKYEITSGRTGNLFHLVFALEDG
ncbi:ATP-binding protein [Alphaproteobacteria bacterium LSUCC0684]